MSAADHNAAKNHWLDAWHVTPSANRDYDFIDGLRGIAILMVLCCHLLYFNPQAGPGVQLVGAFFGTGGRGVMLFFAMSGFLISWPFWKRKFAGSPQPVPAGYGWRRFWKIYPPLALSVFLLVPVCILESHDWSYATVGLQWLSGLPFVLPVSGKLNPVMWTLVVEVQFYAVLPLVFLALRKVSARVCLWVLPLLFLLVPVVYRLITGLNPTLYPINNSHFPSAMDVFFFGILVAGLENAGLMKKGWARFGFVGLILWPLAAGFRTWLRLHPESSSFALDETVGWMEKIASGSLLCFIVDPRHWVARQLCAPWLRWCGIVSYEWYLLHQPIAHWVRISLGPAEGSPLKYLLIIGSTVCISTALTALIYRYFSLPILRFGRTTVGKKKP